MSAPPELAASGHLSRVTLAGPRRRIDLVLPADEPIGVLLPEVVDLVGHQAVGDSRGYQISTLDGTVLDPGRSLRAAEVPDGAMLRVDSIVEAPPAAIVHDVSDEVADDLARRRGRWGDAARRWTATVVCAVAVTVAALLAGPALGPLAVGLIGVAAMIAGLALGVLGKRDLGVAVVLGGAATAMSTVPAWTTDPTVRWTLWTVGAGGTVLAVGTVTGHRRAGLFGGATSLALLAGWSALLAFDMAAERVAAVMAVVSVGTLGLLPRVAMVASGLTRLDDRLSNDEPMSRAAVTAAVDAAHRGLAVAAIATSGSAALAGLVLSTARGWWAVALAGLVAAGLLLRMRAFPLAVEVIAMVGGALVVASGLLRRWVEAEPVDWWAPAAAALGVGAIALVVLAYRPPPHVMARARQNGDRLEAATVMALVPVAVGVFGLYSRLLGTF